MNRDFNMAWGIVRASLLMLFRTVFGALFGAVFRAGLAITEGFFVLIDFSGRSCSVFRQQLIDQCFG